MIIDKKYYQANLLIYYGDLLLTSVGLALAFILCLHTNGLAFLFSYFACVVLIYRGAAFIHELTHQSRSGQLQTFGVVWNLTLGAVTLIPAARFYQPHLTHHQAGIFRTKADPQYLLLRTDWKLALFLLLVVPFIMPAFSLLLVLTSSVGFIDIEGAVERYFARKGYTVGSAIPEKHKKEITWYSRYYLVLIAIYLWLIPETLPLVYAIHVGAWWLSILRIPLEHSMREHLDSSDERDQIIDSFTVESPFAVVLQPLSLRLHTAHHIYPGAPYHNLPPLHAQLKRDNELYRQSIVPFWSAARDPARASASSRESKP